MGMPRHYFTSLEDCTNLVNDFYLLNATTNFNFSESSIQLSGYTASFDCDLSADPLASGWVDFEMFCNANTTSREAFNLSGSGQALFRILCLNTSEHWRAQYWNGSAWVAIGADVTSPTLSSMRKISVNFVIGASGGFTVYADGVQKATVSGVNTTAGGVASNVDKLVFTAVHTTFGAAHVKNIIVDDADTRTLYVHEAQPTSSGVYSEWVGGEPQLDGYSPHENNANLELAYTDADGERLTMGYAAIDSGLDGGTIEGVMLRGLGRAVSDPGLHLRGLCRASGADYETAATVQPTAADWLVFALTFELDPSTGVAWAGKAAVEAAQFGLVSEAA